MKYPELNKLLSSSLISKKLQTEIINLMKNQVYKQLSLFEKTFIDFVVTLELEGMYFKCGEKHSMYENIFSDNLNGDKNLVSENFQVGDVYLQRLDVQNGTKEEAMIKTAVKGTLIEQLQRLTQAVLQKKIIPGMTVIVFIDETRQSYIFKSKAKLFCIFGDDGSVSLYLQETQPDLLWDKRFEELVWI